MWLFDRIRPVTTALGPRIALTLETAKEVPLLRIVATRRDG